MSLNIIDLIKGQLGPALVSQAATQFGESESGISKAINGLLPAVVGGLANNADNPTVIDAIQQSNHSSFLGNLLGNVGGNTVISSVLTAIFGSKLSGLVNSISSFAGISNGNTNSVLNMVTGATLGTIGKYAADNNVDRHGITSMLREQKGVVSTLLPAGLSLASLGFGDWGHTTTNTTNVTNPTTHTTSTTTQTHTTPKVDVTREGHTHVDTKPEEKSSILKWLLPLLALALLSWFLWRQCNKKEEVTTTTTTTVDSTQTAPDTLKVVKKVVTVDLNGTPLKGFENGLESQIIAFLKSGGYENAANDEALKNVWYNFDNVNFEFGKTDVITPESVGQLENLAKILKAYPDAKIKIGGYTDKVGDDKANKALSQGRADYIKKRLTDLGVGAQVIGAEGYGEEFARVAETASDKERETDRKMAVRFAK